MPRIMVVLIDLKGGYLKCDAVFWERQVRKKHLENLFVKLVGSSMISSETTLMRMGRATIGD